jgi:hypothetical protein
MSIIINSVSKSRLGSLLHNAKGALSLSAQSDTALEVTV